MYSQSYRFLDMLGVLCVCNGVALPENQTYITKKWLVEDNVSPFTWVFAMLNRALG